MLRAASATMFVVGVLLGTDACGGSSPPPSYTVPQTTSTPLPAGVNSAGRAATMFANTPMSRLVLSGRFRAPSGFTVESVNPLVPTTGPSYGAVSAVVSSPTAVEYDVTFSPITVPCLTASCTSITRPIAIGTANPANAQAVFSPLVGMSAECGYDPDAHQVGCDTIVKNAYIAVRGDSHLVSTADAVAILRAAIAYMQSLQP